VLKRDREVSPLQPILLDKQEKELLEENVGVLFVVEQSLEQVYANRLTHGLQGLEQLEQID
jgi:hypothetical protein